MSNTKRELAKIAREIKQIKAQLNKSALDDAEFDVVKSAARKGWLQVSKAAKRAGMTITKGLKDAGSKIPATISSPNGGKISFTLNIPRGFDFSKFSFGVQAIFAPGKNTSSNYGPAVWGYKVKGESVDDILMQIEDNVDFALRWISKNK
jgi:flagellin-like hook-associated protein FlgL